MTETQRQIHAILGDCHTAIHNLINTKENSWWGTMESKQCLEANSKVLEAMTALYELDDTSRKVA